jgi:hypothetical protein
MDRIKHHWKGLPDAIRRPLVFIVGALFILAAAATGWLPGPGGIPLFLVGIAILATEFVWAERLRDKVLAVLEPALRWFRANRLLGILLIVLVACGAVFLSYRLYFA